MTETTDSTAESMKSELTPEELRRYARHLIMPEVGREGQERLKAARILLVGAGGLGSPAALYLAAAGIGKLGLVDFDTVDESNLQRQILYGEADVGRSKLRAASDRLADVNPHIEIVSHEHRLDSSNALELFADYDVVVDGTDNFPTRYLVNDACVLAGKPNVYGSIFRFEGQVSVFWGAKGPCYRCLFPEPPPPGSVPSCAEGGVLGVLPGIIGSLQANEAIKLALGAGEPLIGRLVLFDAMGLKFRELKLKKSPDCPVCSESPSLTELIDYEEFCGVAASDAAAQEPRFAHEDLSAAELKEMLERGDDLVVLDVRTPVEHAIGAIEGSKLIPIQEIMHRLGELDVEADIVAYCHTGVRSRQVLEFLKREGFSKVRHLAGGIDSWSLHVDPLIPRY
jgi:adenylyltransferase/sulfurtransferase